MEKSKKRKLKGRKKIAEKRRVKQLGFFLSFFLSHWDGRQETHAGETDGRDRERREIGGVSLRRKEGRRTQRPSCREICLQRKEKEKKKEAEKKEDREGFGR